MSNINDDFSGYNSNYVKIDACENTTNWDTWKDTTGVAQNTSRFKEGAACLKANFSPSANDRANVNELISQLDISGMAKIGFWFYIADAANSYSIELRVGVDDNNYFSFQSDDADYDHGVDNGDNYYEYDLNNPTETIGSPNLNNIQYVSVDYYYDGSAETNSYFLIDDIWAYISPNFTNGVWSPPSDSFLYGVLEVYNNGGTYELLTNSTSRAGASGHGRALRGSATANAFIATYDFRFAVDNGGWGERFLFDYEDGFNFSAVYVSTQYNVIGIEQYVSNVRNYSEVAFTPVVGTVYSVKVEVSGNVVKAYINDVLKVTYTLAQTRTTGGYGLESYSGSTVTNSLVTAFRSFIIDESVDKSTSDSGSGSDSLNLKATSQIIDSGSGSDSLSLEAADNVTDAGSGSDSLSVGQNVADAGSGNDALSVTNIVTLGDSGSGSDSLSLLKDVDFYNQDQRRIKARVKIDYSGNFIDRDATAVASSEYSRSGYNPTPVSQAVNGAMSTKKWFVLGESNLDGTSYWAPLDGSKEIGWYSGNLCNGSGNFATPETITITFAQARTISDIFVKFDESHNVYATDFIVSYSIDGTNFIEIVHPTANSSADYRYTMPSSVDNVLKLKLEINKLNTVNTRARVIEFDSAFSEVYDTDDIVSLSILEEREVSTGSLPLGNISANSLSLKLDNTDNKFFQNNGDSNLYGFLKPNRRITPYFQIYDKYGNLLLEKQMGVFYSADWNSPANSGETTVDAYDRMKLLAAFNYADAIVRTNDNLYQVADRILSDAGLGSSDYNIDSDLNDASWEVPYSYFESISFREALKKVVEACGGYAYFDRDGVLQVEGPDFLANNKTTSVVSITDSNQIIRADNAQKWSQITNSVEIKSSPLVPASANESIYSSNEEVTLANGASITLTLFFNSKPCINVQTPTLSETGLTIDSWTAYAWGGVLAITNNSGSSKTFTIDVQGKPLSQQGGFVASKEDATLIAQQGKLLYSINPIFVQSKAFAEVVAQKILDTFKVADKDIDINCRMNPVLELGDRITVVDSIQSINQDYWIVKQQFDFDGSLIGQITGRKAS